MLSFYFHILEYISWYIMYNLIILVQFLSEMALTFYENKPSIKPLLALEIVILN